MAMFGFNNNMFGNQRSMRPMNRSAMAVNPQTGVNSPTLGYPKFGVRPAGFPFQTPNIQIRPGTPDAPEMPNGGFAFQPDPPAPYRPYKSPRIDGKSLAVWQNDRYEASLRREEAAKLQMPNGMAAFQPDPPAPAPVPQPEYSLAAGPRVRGMGQGPLGRPIAGPPAPDMAPPKTVNPFNMAPPKTVNPFNMAPSDISINRPFGMANLPRPTQSAGGRVLQGVVAGAQANPNIQPSYGSGINPNASPDLRSAAAVGMAMNSVERASQNARLTTPQYRSPAPPPVNPAEVVPYGMGPQSRVPRSGMAGARNVLNGQAQDANTAMRPLNIPGMVFDQASGRMIPQNRVPQAPTADQRSVGLGGMTPNQFRAAQEGEFDGPINETAGGILRRQQAAANYETLDGKQYSPADWQARAERQSLRRAFTSRGGRGRAGFNSFVNNYYNRNGGSSYYNDQFGPGDRAASQQAAYRILRPGAVDRYGSDRRPITGSVQQNPVTVAPGAMTGGVASVTAPQALPGVTGTGRAIINDATEPYENSEEWYPFLMMR